jgi:hypothetical protein
MCDLCRNSWDLVIDQKHIELAIDFERHAVLGQCPQCGALFEIIWEFRAAPKEISVDEARARFPGAL